MTRTTSVLFAAVACTAFLGCGGPKPSTNANADQAAADGGLSEDIATRKILHRKDILEMPGKEAIVILATVPAHSDVGRHSHPGQEIAYILSGSLQLVNDGEEPRTINAGETLSSTQGKIHDVRNVSNVPAKIVDFMVVEKGQPLATQAKDAAPASPPPSK